MIKYTPSSQLTLEIFKHPFHNQLKTDNRWVQLAEVVPWDELTGIYAKNLNPKAGRSSVDLRMVIGALIVKHKLTLGDRDTVDMISENMYMQYFCGLKSFQTELPFDASLFVGIRKRIGADNFDQFNEIVIRRSESFKPKRKRIIKKASSNNSGNNADPGGQITASTEKEESNAKKEIQNQEKLKLDASIADQYITSPNDLKLLNTAREETERLVDVLYKEMSFDKKPRTYRRNARKEYLVVSKKRHKSKKELRVILGKQLRYVRRNISTIEKMLNECEKGKDLFLLNHRDQRVYWVILHLFDQQMYMYKNKVHKCNDRIVNIYQPHVHPMVRGKDKADVEFGAKINIS
jgi:hypothetical protein